METNNELRPNPRKHANFLSILTFWWMIPIVKKGYEQELNESDLFEPLESQYSDLKGDILEQIWHREIENARKKARKPSLARVLIRLFGSSILGYGLRFGFVEIFIKMVQPVALGQLVLFYSSEENEEKLQIILYSVLIVLCSVIATLVNYPTVMATFQKSLKIKIACGSLIYRKSLKLQSNATVGHVVNLLSVDLNNLDLICYFCHHLWIGPCVTIFATVIMYQEMGYSAILGVMFIVATILIQSWLTKFYARLKKKGSIKTDERLDLMTEIIRGFQVIKMLAWENAFLEMVTKIRNKEIRFIKHALYIKGLHVAFTVFRSRSAVFIIVLAFVLSGNILTAREVFVITACLNVMRHSMTDFFTFSIELVQVALISIRRIETFLLQEEIELNYLEYADSVKENQGTKIQLKNVSVSWNIDSKFALKQLNLEVISKGCTAIIGPVGCGKSTLFHVILRELKPSSGEVEICGKLSYAAQNPWIFSGTIKSNIIFGEIYNEERYNKVLQICCLEEDLRGFINQDQTIIGDHGLNLSGGQKTRIHLARAIYKQADIYLLDDPFAGLDASVANQIFINCFREFLQDKICLLITHQLQYLEHCREVIVINQGEIQSRGDYRSIKSELSNLTNLTEESLTVVDSKSKCVSNGVFSKDQPAPKVEEQHPKKRVSWNTYKEYFRATGSYFNTLIVFFLFVIAQISASSGDYFLKYWVNLEQNVTNTTWNSFRNSCILTYSSVTLSTIAVTLLSCFVFYSASTRASKYLHASALQRVMYSSLKFFHERTAGRLLNRFARDVDVTDIIMPYALINCLQTILSIAGVVILVAMVNPWLLIPTVFIFILLNFMRTAYLIVSIQLKRLESTSRSPVITAVTTSSSGLTTIRAHGAQLHMQKQFDVAQDRHTSARYLIIASARMFALWLELICAIYLAIVVFSFLALPTSGGNVGLAITQVLSLMGAIQWGVRQSSELEQQLVAVERLIELRDNATPEQSGRIPSVVWPSKGLLHFDKVSLNYDGKRPALNQVSFTVEPGQKIGIIGRTGSGKTSLINALFQLSDISGNVFIDNLNIKDINRQYLRSKISIIPQEPILFSGNLRKNLDPYEKFNDTDLSLVLKDINFNNRDLLENGLDTKIIGNGSNFSAGEKQLLCLARAIIHDNKICVLDEATANIDRETERIIENFLNNKFADRTVLIIAHRLETIAGVDRILVMEDGGIKEFGHPHVLLQNDSYLKEILAEAGTLTETEFLNAARMNYEK